MNKFIDKFNTLFNEYDKNHAKAAEIAAQRALAVKAEVERQMEQPTAQLKNAIEYTIKSDQKSRLFSCSQIRDALGLPKTPSFVLYDGSEVWTLNQELFIIIKDEDPDGIYIDPDWGIDIAKVIVTRGEQPTCIPNFTSEFDFLAPDFDSF